MPDTIEKSGNMLTNNRVVIGKGVLGTLKIGITTITAALAATDWAQMTGTQQLLVIGAVIVAMITNLQSLLEETTTYAAPTELPVKPAEVPTPAQVEAAKVVADANPKP